MRLKYWTSSLYRILSTVSIAGILAASLQSAYAESSKNAETTGAMLFRDKGCAYCHGANTQGTPKGPSLVNVRNDLKASQIVNQIKNGGQKMPGFDESLSPAEIADLLAYLRAKHRPEPAPVHAAKPTTETPATVPPTE